MFTAFDPERRADCVAKFAAKHKVTREVAESNVPQESPDVVITRKAREMARQTGMDFRQAAREVMRDDFALAESWLWMNGTAA